MKSAVPWMEKQLQQLEAARMGLSMFQPSALESIVAHHHGMCRHKSRKLARQVLRVSCVTVAVQHRWSNIVWRRASGTS